MTVKYLTDDQGNTTNVQLSIDDYLRLLEKANEYPDYVKAGIERGRQQVRNGQTKSTDEVMKKYEKDS